MVSCFSHVQFFATLWTVARQASVSVGFPRQEYWSELSFPLPGHLLIPGIKAAALMSPAFEGGFFITITTWKSEEEK